MDKCLFLGRFNPTYSDAIFQDTHVDSVDVLHFYNSDNFCGHKVNFLSEDFSYSENLPSSDPFTLSNAFSPVYSFEQTSENFELSYDYKNTMSSNLFEGSLNTKTVEHLTNYKTVDYAQSNDFDDEKLFSNSYSNLNARSSNSYGNNDIFNTDSNNNNNFIDDDNNNYKRKIDSGWSSKEIGFIVGMVIWSFILIILVIILIILILRYISKKKLRIENLPSSSSETIDSNALESHSDIIRPDSRSLLVRPKSNSLLFRPEAEAELIKPTTAFVLLESTVQILLSSSLSSID